LGGSQEAVNVPLKRLPGATVPISLPDFKLLELSVMLPTPALSKARYGLTKNMKSTLLGVAVKSIGPSACTGISTTTPTLADRSSHETCHRRVPD
jgi:hypothetical protein